MTVVQIAEVLHGPSGPAWAVEFEPQELLDALRKAKDDLRLTEYVQVPAHLRQGLISRAAVHLNRLDGARMKAGLDAMQQEKERRADA